MRVLDVGPRALLIEVDDALVAAELAGWLRARPDVDALDVVPAACTVLLDGLADPAAVRRVLAAAPTGPAGPLVAPGTAREPDGPVVEVPVVYDGQDLDDVAACWGTDRRGAVARHTSTAFTSAFCGFAPGFAYLAGLPADLAVPRLASPRTRLEPGSVAVADRWCGVYPTASPGGWRVLGRTDLRLWDVEQEPPALLAPGTRVRFREV